VTSPKPPIMGHRRFHRLHELGLEIYSGSGVSVESPPDLSLYRPFATKTITPDSCLFGSCLPSVTQKCAIHYRMPRTTYIPGVTAELRDFVFPCGSSAWPSQTYPMLCLIFVNNHGFSSFFPSKSSSSGRLTPSSSSWELESSP
jgi:hypothetical protein